MKKYVAVAMIVTFVFSSLFLAFLFVQQTTVPETKFVTFTLMVNSETFNQLAANLTAWNFHNFTFAIDPMNNFGLWYLQNQTRIDLLNAYGEAIPVWGYMQQQNPANRLAWANASLKMWEENTGTLPNGVFMFQPDTTLVNYVGDLGIKYVVGGLQDQYLIDWMTEMGSYQLPYYANGNNSLIPQNETSGGVVMLPSISFDIVDSYTKDYFLSTHPVGNGQEPLLNASYIESLVSALNANCKPFGYVSYYFEYDWLYDLNKTNVANEILTNLIRGSSTKHPTLSQFSDWFKTNYDVTPTYRQTFVAPLSGREAEVYFNQSYRLERVDRNQVVFFVNYTKQAADPFLASSSSCTFDIAPSVSNCIWTSAKFTIYSLGGGVDRAPSENNAVDYTGNLARFSSGDS